MKSGDLTYILELEKHFLDIISDIYIGADNFDSMATIQKECMNRLKKKYTDSEIEELKNKMPKNANAPAKSQKIIQKEFLEYTRKVYVPKCIEIRKEIIHHLPENTNINDLVSSLRSDLKVYYDNLKVKIEKNSDYKEAEKLKNLESINRKEKSSKVDPEIGRVWRPDNPKFIKIREAAVSLVPYFIPFEKELNKVIKKRFQIKIGRIGNFMSMSFGGMVDKEERRIISIMNILILED